MKNVKLNRSISKLKTNSVRSKHQKALSKRTSPSKLGAQWKHYLDQQIVAADGDYPITSRRGIIMITAYEFTLGVLVKNKLESVRDAVAKRKKSEKFVDTMMNRNPFQLSLRYLCCTGMRKIEEKLQDKYARQLHYAFLHNVPSQDLLGFLYQEGSYDRINRRYSKLIKRLRN